MHTNVLRPAGRVVNAQSTLNPTSGAIDLRRLARAAALTAAATVLGDLLVYGIGGLWGVPGEYAPFFNPVSIVASVLFGVAVAAIALAVLSRVTHRAAAVFRTAAVALTLLSLGAPLQALAGAMPGFAAATAATGLAMIAMHLITGGAIAGLLLALARR